MLQVISNTEVITDWLGAIKSCPLAACPMNSAAHALIPNVLLADTQLINMHIVPGKKNPKVSQFPPFWNNCTRRWDQGKGLVF